MERPNIAHGIGFDGLFQVLVALRVRFQCDDISVGAHDTGSECGVVADIRAHIEKGHSIVAGGIKKLCLSLFINTKVKCSRHNGISGIEHHGRFTKL